MHSVSSTQWSELFVKPQAEAMSGIHVFCY